MSLKLNGLAALIVLLGSLLRAESIATAAPAPSTAATNPLWHSPKIRNYLPDMTWPEVQDLLSRSDMVIIPVGALEQHGPHGPIGTDFYAGTQIAALVAQRTDILVVPILMPGNSPYHMGFPGTITLSGDTLQRVYFEAAQSLIQHGFRRFIFLNAHGGNAATTRFIVDRINQETAATAVDLDQATLPFLNKAHLPAPVNAALEALPEIKVFDRHAGVNETSFSLYLMPNLVEMTRVPPPHPLTLPAHLKTMLPNVIANDPTKSLLFLSEALKARATGKTTSTREMTPTGIWSEADTAQATASRGKAKIDAYVAASVQFIDNWKKEVPLHRQ